MAISVRAVAQPSALRRHHLTGASTGYMSDLRGDWPAQIEAAWEFSPFAVELSALAEQELDGLIRYLQGGPPLPFRYLSVHGPSKNRAMPEPDLVAILGSLAPLVSAIVMHPDTISDPSPYRQLGRKLVLENMDARKPDGRTATELAPWFGELPEAGFCFDVAHAWSIDQTMGVGTDLLDAFRGRLRYLHVSSLSDELHHVPLTAEHEELFAPLLDRCRDVPWILEAPLRDS